MSLRIAHPEDIQSIIITWTRLYTIEEAIAGIEGFDYDAYFYTIIGCIKKYRKIFYIGKVYIPDQPCHPFRLKPATCSG